MATNNCECSCGSSSSTSQKVIKTTFLLRRGTTSAWESANPTLQYGEPGYEKDTGKLKIGDGIHAWNELPYLTDETGTAADVDNKSIEVDATGKISIYGFSTAEVNQMPIVGADGKLEWIELPNFEELENRIEDLEEKAIDPQNDVVIIYGGSADDVIIEAHNKQGGN